LFRAYLQILGSPANSNVVYLDGPEARTTNNLATWFKEENLHVINYNEDASETIKSKYPKANIYQMNYSKFLFERKKNQTFIGNWLDLCCTFQNAKGDIRGTFESGMMDKEQKFVFGITVSMYGGKDEEDNFGNLQYINNSNL
jgi:hypothetical protein